MTRDANNGALQVRRAGVSRVGEFAERNRRAAPGVRVSREMAAWRGTAIACATLVAAALGVLLVASAWAKSVNQSKERPRGVVESCATQSGARFPGAFTSPRNLVVGPLALVGAGGAPNFVWDSTGLEGFQKFQLLVKENHRVTVELSQRTRRGAGLAYGPLPEGEVHLRDAHRVVTFIACRSGKSLSSADGQPVTFWSGAVLARSPRCVPLLVWVDNQPSPRRVVIRLGVRNCGQ
jgi:hypothetical protein